MQLGHAAPARQGLGEQLAELGFAAFALDMYGKGVRGGSPEENAALMAPLMEDRDALQRRINLAVATLRQQPEVEAASIAASGYCFGGLCALDLAREGVLERYGVEMIGARREAIEMAETLAAPVLVVHSGCRGGHTRSHARRLLSQAVELFAAGLKRCDLEYADVWRLMALERGGRHSSQDVEAMIPGEVARSFLLNPNGKLTALLWVLRGSERVGLFTDRGMAERITPTVMPRKLYSGPIQFASRPAR